MLAAAQQILLGPQLQAPGGSASPHALAGSGRRFLLASQSTAVSASLQPGPGQVCAVPRALTSRTAAGLSFFWKSRCTTYPEWSGLMG